MSAIGQLPTAEKEALSLGYLPLTDSAPLIVAQQLGLFEKYGLESTLQREVSWANLRDKVVTGDLDGAQMLAPLPLATSLGVGGLRADMVTGLVLSLNGNAITCSQALSRAIAKQGGDLAVSAASTARALGRHVQQCAKNTRDTLTFASAHSFSCHTFELRLWLQAGGIDPQRDVRIIVLPPEQMADSLERGLIDGFCVGEPWNTVAVQAGLGTVQATGHQIWNNGIEKVLAVTTQWHQRHPATHLRLRLALMEACNWLAEAENLQHAATLLAAPAYLDMPLDLLTPSLSGKFQYRRDGPQLEIPDFHVFHRFQAGFPWRSDGEWLLQQTAAVLGKTLSAQQITAVAEQTFRTDLYRQAAQYLDLPCPSSDCKPDARHAETWEIEPGIELGPDLRLTP